MLEKNKNSELLCALQKNEYFNLRARIIIKKKKKMNYNILLSIFHSTKSNRIENGELIKRGSYILNSKFLISNPANSKSVGNFSSKYFINSVASRCNGLVGGQNTMLPEISIALTSRCKAIRDTFFNHGYYYNSIDCNSLTENLIIFYERRDGGNDRGR